MRSRTRNRGSRTSPGSWRRCPSARAALCSVPLSRVWPSVLQRYLAVLDPSLERLDGQERREGLGPPGAKVEQRTVPGTLPCTGGRVDLSLRQRPVVVRATVLDRVQLAVGAPENADLSPVRLDQTRRSLGELLELADRQCFGHRVQLSLADSSHRHDLHVRALRHVIPTSALGILATDPDARFPRVLMPVCGNRLPKRGSRRRLRATMPTGTAWYLG